MVIDKIKILCKNIADSLSYEFVGLNFNHSNGILEIYIDKNNAINADDCAKYSRNLNVLLDVENLSDNIKNLIVSSPGINRPLFEIDDYAKHIEEQVKIKLLVPNIVNNQKNYKGIIKKVDDDTITIIENKQQIEIDYQNIAKANIVGQIKG
ncbi:MAG: ribosome maturation factor RimP [Gammaproteobacteria bacterium]|nr:MAG: ribosome maturation factor RimP [Gammaproteobacteria bacterium]